MVSESAQDYLKAIWKLQAAHGEATTSALAGELGVSPASATAMLKKLDRLGLVQHEPYHGARLTPAGERVALEVIRHHRLLELYLKEALGLSWDQVHAEAERLEHYLSDEVEARIDAAWGTPRATRTATRSPPPSSCSRPVSAARSSTSRPEMRRSSGACPTATPSCSATWPIWGWCRSAPW